MTLRTALARDFLKAASDRLDTLPAALSDAERALEWAVRDIRHAVEQLLVEVESPERRS